MADSLLFSRGIVTLEGAEHTELGKDLIHLGGAGLAATDQALKPFSLCVVVVLALHNEPSFQAQSQTGGRCR